jgi:glyoxylase I family protein
VPSFVADHYGRASRLSPARLIGSGILPPMRPLGAFHHVALTVSDLERSAEWYSRVLGLVELFREDSPSRRAVVYRFADGGTSVGLVEHAGSEDAGFVPTHTGLDHLAFSVASQQDMRDWATHLDDHRVAYSGPIEIPPGEILNFRDPDGIALALFWDREA